MSIFGHRDIVQCIMGHLSFTDFLSLRAVNNLTRHVGGLCPEQWYKWLYRFGKRAKGKPVLLKQVPLQLQVLRQASAFAQKRFEGMLLTVENDVIRNRQRLDHALGRRRNFLESAKRHRVAFDVVNAAFVTRKRKKIVLPFLTEDE